MRVFRSLAFALALATAPIAGASLTGCATPIVSAQNELLIAKVETGFEKAYNVAASIYLAKVGDGSLTGPKKAQAKDGLQKWRKAVLALRSAERLGNAADVATQTAAIIALSGQVSALLH